MAQEAYDFARFETTARVQGAQKTARQGAAKETEQESQQSVRLRSVKGGGRRYASAWQKIFNNIATVLCVIAFFATAFALVQSEAKLTEYTQQIQTQQTALTEAQSEYNYLESTLNASVNLDQVERVAKQLGLVKVNESQVTYIRIEEEALLTTVTSDLEQWQATLQGIWEKVICFGQ